MGCFGDHRNLYEYHSSTLENACIQPATTDVTKMYLVQHCDILK
jgi:hypothetical protein